MTNVLSEEYGAFNIAADHIFDRRVSQMLKLACHLDKEKDRDGKSINIFVYPNRSYLEGGIAEPCSDDSGWNYALHQQTMKFNWSI